MKKYLILLSLLFTAIAYGDPFEYPLATQTTVATNDWVRVINNSGTSGNISFANFITSMTSNGAWSLNLNPTVGSIQSFPLTLTGTAVALNPSVSPFDIAGYAAVSDIVDMDISGMYGGNWLAHAVVELRARISREGYSAGVMLDYQNIKDQLGR